MSLLRVALVNFGVSVLFALMAFATDAVGEDRVSCFLVWR